MSSSERLALDSFRLLIAPQLAECDLLHLRAALVADDPRLIQGQTCVTADNQFRVAGYGVDEIDALPLAGACAVSFGAFARHAAPTIADADRLFNYVAIHASDLVHRELPGGGWWAFTGWWDATPRAQAIASLLPVVDQVIASRVA